MERFRGEAPLHVVQPPYNLFEREIEAEILPYCHKNGIATFGYGALCRGRLSGRIKVDTKFEGDDLRRADPKFQPPRFAQYLAAVERLDHFAQERYGKRVINLAVRWMLDQGVTDHRSGRAGIHGTPATSISRRRQAEGGDDASGHVEG
jgi:aryl-alcohol dehydrogenase-like predicted oxidoreductase